MPKIEPGAYVDKLGDAGSEVALAVQGEALGQKEAVGNLEGLPADHLTKGPQIS